MKSKSLEKLADYIEGGMEEPKTLSRKMETLNLNLPLVWEHDYTIQKEGLPQYVWEAMKKEMIKRGKSKMVVNGKEVSLEKASRLSVCLGQSF